MRIVFRWDESAPQRQDSLGALREIVLASGLPFAHAKQNPHVARLVYGPSVKRGELAAREYADIYLLSSVSSEQVRTALAQHSLPGFTLLEVQRVPYTLAGVQQLASAVKYQAEGDFSSAPQTLENYVAAARLESVYRAANGMSLLRDMKPYVVSAKTVGPQRIEFLLRSIKEKWMNPLDLLYGWLGIEKSSLEADKTDERFKIIRQGLYWQDSQNVLHLI